MKFQLYYAQDTTDRKLIRHFFQGLMRDFGVKYRNIMIDYSFSPYGRLGIAHKVSIGIKFGKNYADNVNAKMREQTRKNLSKFRNIVQEEK